MRRQLAFALIVAALVPAFAVLGQTKVPKSVKRAQPPKFSKTDNFYGDAFKEGMVGERPTDLSKSAPLASGGNSGAPGSAQPGGSGAGGVAGSGWAAIISGPTVENEIKGLKLLVDQHVTTPSDFAGKGYKQARRDFTMLAMLFAIAGEYEGEVRWKNDAPAARDVFAQTAANAKVGTQQVWKEAKLRKDELGEMVERSPFAGKTAEAKAPWKDVCGRAPLMQHLELIWDPKLKPSLADKGQFTANSEKVVHDAEIVAAIGQVLAKEGMEDADSEEYTKFCDALRDGAKAIVEGAKTKNYEQAAAGGAIIGKACVECHENYRS